MKLTIDWSACGEATIRGVLFYTNPYSMHSGTTTFKVDDVECPDTNGVGVGAVGGVFNCGLTGTRFTIEHTNDSNWYIHELRLWKRHIFNLEGNYYYLAGNSVTGSNYSGVSWSESDIPKLFKTGSIYDPGSGNCVGIS